MTRDQGRDASFRESLGGYGAHAVDELLERVALELERGRSPRATIQATRLPRALRGYSVQQVDGLLGELSGEPTGSGPWTDDRKGQHFGAGTVALPDLPPDTWLTPPPEGHRLVVMLRARGVRRVVRFGSMDRMDPFVWPLSWLAHFALYRGQWAVEVVNVPVGRKAILGVDRVVFSRAYPSRARARRIRDEVEQRIALLEAQQSGPEKPEG